MKVSYSRVSSYLGCNYSHYLGYVKKLRPKGIVRPLTFGKDFHSLLQYRNNKKQLKITIKDITEAYENLPPLLRMDLGDSYLQDLKNIFNDYNKVWSGSEQPIKTEHEFLIPISKLKGDLVYFHGVIDEVYEDCFGEHKTFNQMPSMDILAMNMQVCLYAKAWEKETGQTFEQVKWDYIRSSPAESPIWLEKSGRFSDAKSSKITPYSWKRACKERNIEDEELIRKGEQYKANVANYFFRCNTVIVPKMVQTVWEDFMLVVREIVLHGEKNKAKNISRNCSWCKYRPICYGEFTGANIDYIINRDFEVKEESEKDTIEAIMDRIGE